MRAIPFPMTAATLLLGCACSACFAQGAPNAQAQPSAASISANSAMPAAPKPAPVLGAYEASGARVGMTLPLAFEAISATKPAWAPGIAQQAAIALKDCASDGRGIVLLQGSDGFLAAAIEAGCEPDPAGKELLVRALKVKARLSPELTVAQVRQALTERYGPAGSDRADAGGGFEMTWLAPAQANPGAPQRETLTATLQARGVEATPAALTLTISAALPKPGAPAAETRPSALSTLPF